MGAGKLEEVVGKLARHICLHVLKPLLQLHPQPILFQTQIQHDSDDGSYSLEVRYGPASAQEEQGVCSVESATLQCLQAITRKLWGAIATVQSIVNVPLHLYISGKRWIPEHKHKQQGCLAAVNSS